MRRIQKNKITKSLLGLVLMSGLGGGAFARHHKKGPPFKFVGGTEKIRDSCPILVEVGSVALTYRCSDAVLSIPYSSITLMQYRPDISRKIKKMNIKWAVKPPAGLPLLSGSKNRYFTVVYEEQGDTRAVVLSVPPQTMRPYLAEIDVKAGKRVEVKETEELD